MYVALKVDPGVSGFWCLALSIYQFIAISIVLLVQLDNCSGASLYSHGVYLLGCLDFMIVCFQIFHKYWMSMAMCTSAQPRLRARVKDYCYYVASMWRGQRVTATQSKHTWLLPSGFCKLPEQCHDRQIKLLKWQKLCMVVDRGHLGLSIMHERCSYMAQIQLIIWA